MTISKKGIMWIGGITLTIATVWAIYYFGKKAGGKIPLPNSGGGIPQGWSAGKNVEDLKNLFSGFWSELFNVNFDKIKNELANLTDDQLAAIANEYQHDTGNSLFDAAKDYLSEDDFLKFTAIFQNVL